ncbi:MAG TPA: response regulator [Methylomirabilota bacterium]|nr:response regulator [Methylomirabilota bacterium]
MLNESASILVLDDEPLIAELLSELLSISGYQVTTCTRPDDALAVAREGDFDLVLTDFCMPRMNGRQFYLALCSIRPDLANSVLFLTGGVLNSEMEAWLESMALPQMLKPFTMKSLQHAVTDALIRAAELQDREGSACSPE